jgi:hypothetical protein
MTNYLTRVIFPASIAGIMLLGCQALTSIDRSDIQDDLFKSPAGATGTAGDDSGGSGDPGGSDTGGSGGEGGGAGEAGAGGGAGEAGAGGEAGGGAGEAGAGQGGGGAAGAGGGAALSFETDVLPKLSKCTAACHDPKSATPSGGLKMTFDDLKAGDQKSTCAEFPTYLDLVDPEKSFLYNKLLPVAGNTALPVGCGDRMPQAAPPASGTGNQVLADLVLQWIQGGAQP